MSRQKNKFNLIQSFTDKHKADKQLFYFLSFGIPILGAIWASEIWFDGMAESRHHGRSLVEGINQLKAVIGNELTVIVILTVSCAIGFMLFKTARGM